MRKTVFILLLITALPGLVFAWADWKAVSNQHFRIYYKDRWESEAIEVLRTMEYYRPYLEELNGNQRGQVPVTIEDIGNIVNGYTDPFSNRIVLFAYPPTNDELAVCEDWWQLVGSHEYIHMLQITREGGIPKWLRIGLGNYLFPQIHQPAWMTEGITVYGESRLSPFTGRMNGGTFPATIKALAAQGNLPSPTKASYYSYDTPHAQFYTFGGAFYTYLAQTYGEEKFSLLFGSMSSSLTAYLNPLFPYFNLDKAYKKVYGKPLRYLWRDWIESERNSHYALPEHNLTEDGWFKTDLQSDSSSYYYLAGKAEKTDPGSSFFSYKLLRKPFENQKAADSSRPQVLLEQSNDFPAGYYIRGNKLYYTRSEYRKGFANTELDGYGSITELWQKDLTTGKRALLHTGQFRAFFPLQEGTFLISEDDENHKASALYLVSPSTGTRELFYESDMLIYKLLPYKEKLVLGGKRSWQTGSIYIFDPQSKEVSSLVDTPYYEVPVSIQGDSLIFNAVYDGNYSTYILNLQSMQTYSYAPKHYMGSPALVPDGKVMFISINSGGFDIYSDYLQPQPYEIKPAAAYQNPWNDETDMTSGTRDFVFSGKGKAFLSNLAHMTVPRLLHMPLVSGTGDSLSIGYMLVGRDATGDFPFWSAMVYYDTYYDKVKYGLSLENAFFRPVRQVISYSNEDEQTLSSILAVTLYKRMNYGLRNVTTGFSFITSDNYKRKVWTPNLQMNWGWSTGSLATMQSIPYETKDFLPSDRERLGWQSFYQARQKMPLSSELRTSIHLAIDPEADPDEVFAPIRGYSSSLSANEGITLKTSWYKPVIQVREGLWNPQVYLEDINVGLFYDASAPFDGEQVKSRYSTGAELLAELGLAYYLRVNAGIRFSLRNDRLSRFEFFIDTLF
jgi:hypothetical protein